MSFHVESFLGAVQFEGPQEIVGFLKVSAACVDFINQVLHAHDSLLLEALFHDLVVSERNSVSIDLSKPSFVDQIGDRLSSGVPNWVSVFPLPIGDMGLHESDHIHGCFVDLHEGCVVELPQSQELQDSSCFGVLFLRSGDSNHQGDLWFGFNVDVSVLPGLLPGKGVN